MPPTVTSPQLDEVIDAMRSVQTESDRWHLAEALQQQVPNGLKGFSVIIDAAAAAGVSGNLSVNTLRLYRDAAVRWPASKRVKNVSFSAHREAMVMENIDSAVKMLEDLASTNGAAKVTVAAVRKAVAVKQGKPLPQPKGTKAATPAPFDVLHDIKAGAPNTIKAIPSETTVGDLEKLHAGLSKVIAHVERLRSKAARKATPAKAAPKATPAKATPTKAAPKAKAAGDLRGL